MAEDGGNVWKPLAQRRKPVFLRDFIGQESILGKNSFLRRMIAGDNLKSIILYGPPGSGKTSIAEIIANETKSLFMRINAVTSGIADIKDAVSKAKDAILYSKRSILFIDEIHRFNKKQQDALLPYVEDGLLTMIGATTENPYFEVNSALISRCMVLRLESLGREDIRLIIERALAEDKEIGSYFSAAEDAAVDIIFNYSGGDARKALNLLEAASVHSDSKTMLSAEILKKTFGENSLNYDKSGDQHYDTISAFIKSIRGSDPDAALHYLARMLESGEDPMFIARRIVISASEDIGNADPAALILAIACKDAVHFVGMPEARIHLAQAVTYLASSPKSNRSYMGINMAIQDVKNLDIGAVPKHLKDASYPGAVNLGNGASYKYPHDFPNAYVKQQYLPDEIKDKRYYEPTDRGREKTLKAYLDNIRCEGGGNAGR